MRYKVNASCPMCGRRYSYWSDDPLRDQLCPRSLDPEHVVRDEPKANGICNGCDDIPYEQW